MGLGKYRRRIFKIFYKYCDSGGNIVGISISNIIIHSDANGNYKARDLICQLQKAKLGIEFPNKPLDEICLADLKCEGESCTYSFSEGVVWDNELRTYIERKLTLCFD